MIKAPVTERQRLVLYGVSWTEYTRLLRSFEDRHIRLTYDRGTLEIMTLTHEHESDNFILGQLVVALTQALKLPLKGGGSTTFRKRKKQKGLEPDNCYWIAHADAVRGKKKIDLRTDPPPDLAIEVDITHSSINRMRIYASLGIPEVWRLSKKGLGFYLLTDGKYVSVATSPTFPIAITPADLMVFIAKRDKMDDNAIIEEFREWIQTRQASQT